MQTLRLPPHRQRRASGQIAVDGPDLLGDVREGFVKELEALLLDFAEVILGLLRSLSRLLKVFLGAFQPALHTFQPLDGSHVWCHLVQLAIEGGDLLLQLVIELLVRILDDLSVFDAHTQRHG